MRWLNDRLRSERGASAVMFAILLVPLIGFAGIAVDVGALYAERAQLQNGADAAALAIAQDCATNGVCTDPSGTAARFANANANDGAANVLTPTFPTSNTVTVTSSTRVAGTNAPTMSHPFAALIGATPTTVHASATAQWGGPSAATVFPLALSFCEFQASETAPGQLMTIRTDTNKICKKDSLDVPGGFGWLDLLGANCEAYVNLNAAGELWMGSKPGNSVANVCKTRLTALKGTTVLIPIYDASRGTGQNAQYRIYAFAAFKVTGWKFSGFSDIDPAAPPCSGGNCRGIQGVFVRWVSVDSSIDLGGPALNGFAVKLIN